MNKTVLKIVFLFIGCCLYTTSKAQLSTSPKDRYLNISYFGHDIFQPGLKVGGEFHLFMKNKVKKNDKVISNSIFISPQIGLNLHNKNHTALVVNLELGFQKRFPTGLYVSTSLGVGSLTQFNWGVTYELNDNGIIQENKWASRSYFLPNLNVEIGKNINSKISCFGKFTGTGKVNYNTVPFFPQLFWELGMKFSLNSKRSKMILHSP